MFLGLKWWRSVWLKAAAIFWTIFLVLYTSVFTQGQGFFIGLQGALGYWISQQEVQRGTQPLYYYAFLQIPIYEFLPALGALTAFIIALKKKLLFNVLGEPFLSSSLDQTESLELSEMEPVNEVEGELDAVHIEAAPEPEPLVVNIEGEEKTSIWERAFPEPLLDTTHAPSLPTVFLLLYWSLMSLLAFTAAGERMPWLTTHITMPLILTSGWSLSWLVHHIDWEQAKQKRGWLVFGLSIVFIVAFVNLLGSVFGTTPPFAGKDLVSLQNTSTFLLAFIGSAAFGLGLWKALKSWQGHQIGRFLLLGFFSILAVLTFRTSWRAALLNTIMPRNSLSMRILLRT